MLDEWKRMLAYGCVAAVAVPVSLVTPGVSVALSNDSGVEFTEAAPIESWWPDVSTDDVTIEVDDGLKPLAGQLGDTAVQQTLSAEDEEVVLDVDFVSVGELPVKVRVDEVATEQLNADASAEVAADPPKRRAFEPQLDVAADGDQGEGLDEPTAPRQSDGVGEKIEVSASGGGAAEKVGADELALSFDVPSDVLLAVSVEIDYSHIVGEKGGDYADRLHPVVFEECADAEAEQRELQPDEVRECGPGSAAGVDAEVNLETQTMVLDITLGSQPGLDLVDAANEVVADVDRSLEPTSATTVPSTTVPPTTIPSTTVPLTTIPSTTVPSATVPSTTVPLATVPSTTMPSATGPATSAPPATVPPTTVPPTTAPPTTAPPTTAPPTTVPPTTAVENHGVVEQPESSAVRSIVALQVGPSGEQGDYTATPLSQSAEWSQGGSAGGFSWSYPFQVPDWGLGGPTPAMSVGYSSQSVDGMNASSSPQPSAAGLGWDLGVGGYITRSYSSCGAVVRGNSSPCWSGWNASLVLNGVSSRLVPLNRDTWRLENDNGWRVYRKKRSAVPGAPAWEQDALGEYWEIVTLEGVRYTFGYGTDPNNVRTRSTWSIPVQRASYLDAERCPSGSWCYQPWRWNLDRVTSTDGKYLSLFYEPEVNYFGFQDNRYQKKEYVRGGNISKIEWGRSPGLDAQGDKNPPYRVLFDYRMRCAELKDNCAEPNKDSKAASYPDVPVDQLCSSSGTCRNYSPAYFTTKRLVEIRTETYDRNRKKFSLLDRWKLSHAFTGSFNDADRPTKLWLKSLQHFAGSQAAPAVTFGAPGSAAQLPNRADPSVKLGVPEMILPRVNRIDDELGGRVEVEYFQQTPCDVSAQEGKWATDQRDCYQRYYKPDKAPRAGFGAFNVYLVKSVTEKATKNKVTAPVTTTYQYHGKPALRYAAQIGTPTADQSWSTWRGYGRVTETVGTGAERLQTDTTYFRGMHSDRLGGSRRRKVTVSTVNGAGGQKTFTRTDHPSLAGRVFERRIIGADGKEISGEVFLYGRTRYQKGMTTAQHWGGVPGAYKETPYTQMWHNITTFSRRSGRSNPNLNVAKVSHKYDSAGRLVGTTEYGRGGSDTRCHTVQYVKIPNSKDTDSRLPSAETTLEGACPGKRVAAKVSTAYDSKGRVISINNGVAAEKTEYASSRTDMFERPAKQTNRRGYTTTISYSNDSRGWPTTVTTTDPYGKQALSEMDVRGNTKRTVINGATTESTYDAFGRLTSLKAPTEVGSDFNTAEFGYLLPGGDGRVPRVVTRRLVSKSPKRYTTTAVLMDGLGRELETQTDGPSGRLVTGTRYGAHGLANASSKATHDSRAVGTDVLFGLRIPSSVDQVTTTYDGEGRVTKSVERVAGGSSYTTSTRYVGYKTYVESPGGRTSTTYADRFGRTVYSRLGNGAPKRFAYDVMDRQVWRRIGGAKQYDETKYTYDLGGRMTSMTDTSSGTTSYSYNANDSLTKVRNADGHEVVTRYNKVDQPYQRLVGGKVAARWFYDAKGRMYQSRSWDDHATYTERVVRFDIMDRPLGMRYTVNPTNGHSRFQYSTRSSYNDAGDLATSQSGRIGAMSADTVTYGYDQLQNPTTMKSAESGVLVAGINYDELNRVAERVLGEGSTAVTRRYEYNSRRQLESAAFSIGAQDTYSEQRYGYDVDGNTSTIDHIVGSQRHRECFTFDQANRLTSAHTEVFGATCDGSPGLAVEPAGVGYKSTWRFNLRGDIASRTHQTRESGRSSETFTYEGTKRRPTKVGDTTFEYSEAGFRTASSGNPAAYRWTAQGKLAETTDRDGNKTSYFYGADGQRYAQALPSGDTIYYLGDVEVTRNTDGDFTTVRRTFSHAGTAVGTRVVGDGGDNISWLVGNAQGSLTTAVTNGRPDTRYYTPYGGERGPQPASSPTTTGFLGQHEDTSGLSYLNARYYDPASLTFISVDPINQATGEPYTYASGNPVTYSDPTGFEPRPFHNPNWKPSDGWSGYEHYSYTPEKHRWGQRDHYTGKTYGPVYAKNNYKPTKEQVQELVDGFLIIGGFVPVVGEGIDGTMCVAGDNYSCAGIVVPFAGGRLLRRVWRAIRPVRAAPVDMSTLPRAIRTQVQNRHVQGTRQYDDKMRALGRPPSYFKDSSDAQTILDAIHSGDAQIIGRTPVHKHVVVQFDGFDLYKPMYVNEVNGAVIEKPTNVFFVKGEGGTGSVVPYNPDFPVNASPG